VPTRPHFGPLNGPNVEFVTSRARSPPARHAAAALGSTLPYATAKAAVDGLTRAIAVDYGPPGIRANAVALGSISTARYEALAAERPEIGEEMCRLHPLGRRGRPGGRRPRGPRP